MTVTRDTMRELLLTIFRGWIIVDERRDPTSMESITTEDAMTEAAGGDELIGNTIALMTYWDNDLISIAPHYGISLRVDPETEKSVIREDIPPAPSSRHWWDLDNEVWVAPEEDSTEVEAHG